MYTYIYIYIYAYIHTYEYVCAYIYIYMTFTYLLIYLFIYLFAVILSLLMYKKAQSLNPFFFWLGGGAVGEGRPCRLACLLRCETGVSSDS